jgi:hypothetical protein
MGLGADPLTPSRGPGGSGRGVGGYFGALRGSAPRAYAPTPSTPRPPSGPEKSGLLETAGSFRTSAHTGVGIRSSPGACTNCKRVRDGGACRAAIYGGRAPGATFVRVPRFGPPKAAAPTGIPGRLVDVRGDRPLGRSFACRNVLGAHRGAPLRTRTNPCVGADVPIGQRLRRDLIFGAMERPFRAP